MSNIIKKDYEKIFEKNTKYDVENSIIIDNEITLILSLCNLDIIRILEKKKANIFIHEEIAPDIILSIK